MRSAIPTAIGLLLTLAIPGSATAEEPEADGYGMVFSTVFNSEWCPSGSVQVDLRNGRYQLTRRASRAVCWAEDTERPLHEGTLDDEQLETLRSAYRVALTEDLQNEECGPGGHPEFIVVSNGGPQALVLTAPNQTLVAPEYLGCWSAAAEALYETLELTFAPRQ